MSDQKLYYYDSYKTEFQANIIEVLPYGEQFALVLDKTYFYPESGGQPADIGFINDATIVDVIEKDDKTLHITEVQPEPGPANCRLNWVRRFDHMQQHSGQHILSACFYRLFRGETSSFHISQESSTIEIDVTSFDAAMAEQLEKLANEYVFRSLPISAEIVDQQKLKSLPLRKQPQVESDIRIVTIEECDCTPGGGTHVRNTGEIGLIKLRKWEKLKSSYKFDFVCGNRGLKDYTNKNYLVNKLSAHLSAPEAEVEKAFLKLTEDYKALQKQISQLRTEIVAFEVQELLAGAEAVNGCKVVHKVYDNRAFNDVKLIAQGIASQPGHIALLASSNENQQLIFTCAQDVTANMNNILKEALPFINGKGGGSPKAAQGGGCGDIHQAMSCALDSIRKL